MLTFSRDSAAIQIANFLLHPVDNPARDPAKQQHCRSRSQHQEGNGDQPRSPVRPLTSALACAVEAAVHEPPSTGDSGSVESPSFTVMLSSGSPNIAIANTADAIRTELLKLAQKMPDSPLAGAQPDDVVLMDGMIVSKENAGRAVSIADAMRQGHVERGLSKKARPTSRRTTSTRATRIRRSSPR